MYRSYQSSNLQASFPASKAFLSERSTVLRPGCLFVRFVSMPLHPSALALSAVLVKSGSFYVVNQMLCCKGGAIQDRKKNSLTDTHTHSVPTVEVIPIWTQHTLAKVNTHLFCIISSRASTAPYPLGTCSHWHKLNNLYTLLLAMSSKIHIHTKRCSVCTHSHRHTDTHSQPSQQLAQLYRFTLDRHCTSWQFNACQYLYHYMGHV